MSGAGDDEKLHEVARAARRLLESLHGALVRDEVKEAALQLRERLREAGHWPKLREEGGAAPPSADPRRCRACGVPLGAAYGSEQGWCAAHAAVFGVR